MYIESKESNIKYNREKHVFKALRRLIYRNIQPAVVTVEDEEEITDEIEKSLWQLKEAYDFDTEEIKTVVNNYKGNKGKEKK
jgi:hypothetical protein